MTQIISVSPNHDVIRTETLAKTVNQLIEQILKQQSETGWVTHAVVYDESGDFSFVHAEDDMECNAYFN